MTTCDTEILAAMDSDRERGFRLLVSRYGEPLYWHVRRLVVLHDDAQDATQETFVRVYRSYDSFRGDSSLAVWLYRLATNEALSILKRRREGVFSLDDPGLGLESVRADEYIDYSDIEAVRLQEAILRLPAKQQIAFNMRYYDDMSYADIAAVTGATVVSVKSNYHIAKEKILKYFSRADMPGLR